MIAREASWLGMLVGRVCRTGHPDMCVSHTFEEVTMATAKGQFELASWNEDTYQELDGGAKLTRASVTQDFSGDVTGGGTVEWLMCYRPDGTARFVGLQRVEGTVGGMEGSFVAESVGNFEDVAGRAGSPGGNGWMCRLCDLGACGRADGRCPVAGENLPSF